MGGTRTLFEDKKKTFEPYNTYTVQKPKSFEQNSGVGHNIRNNPREIDLTACPTVKLKPVSSLTDLNKDYSKENSSVKADIREGSIIEHQRFGEGKILGIEGSGENMKATVQFVNAGIKQLLLKFARYKISRF